MIKTTTPTGESVKPMDNTFWLDGWEGKCHSGFYVRSDLFKKLEEFEKMGYKVVGIKIEPNSWNMEFICEVQEEKSIEKEVEKDGN